MRRAAEPNTGIKPSVLTKHVSFISSSLSTIIRINDVIFFYFLVLVLIDSFGRLVFSFHCFWSEATTNFREGEEEEETNYHKHFQISFSAQIRFHYSVSLCATNRSHPLPFLLLFRWIFQVFQILLLLDFRCFIADFTLTLCWSVF